MMICVANVNKCDFLCKSTEEKPIENIPEGSTIYEVDTGNIYVFYDNEWFKM